MKGLKVFVGLSGGVDSAVTAALLKDQGAQVTGVFIQGWYPPGLPCSWREDRRDAMRVAARLQIPFVTLDASHEYKQSVIDYLIREYGAGRTPNPDIFCNRDVKFGAFYRFAKERGADALATGHYARTKEGRLYRGKDEGKDQSYFLWAVPKDALAMTQFPLGELHKQETRVLAKRYNLPVADKKDSQGICFLGTVSIDDFLRSELTVENGKAIDTKGNDVGIHEGALLYTLGERVGLPGGPWYVVKKDLATNTLSVSKEPALSEKDMRIRLTDMNWFGEPRAHMEAQYRYHGPIIHGAYADGVFTPDEPLPETPSPGQSLVFYSGEECIGGGIIN